MLLCTEGEDNLLLYPRKLLQIVLNNVTDWVPFRLKGLNFLTGILSFYRAFHNALQVVETLLVNLQVLIMLKLTSPKSGSFILVWRDDGKGLLCLLPMGH